jgi:hypothetical protein
VTYVSLADLIKCSCFLNFFFIISVVVGFHFLS